MQSAFCYTVYMAPEVLYILLAFHLACTCMYNIYLKLIFPHVSTDLILKVYTYITYIQMYVCMTYGDI